MRADQIRSAFLKYFAERGHRVVRSSALVPENDPSLLFANAGMNQFKDVFLGRERRDYTRAASSQKCVRAGGKHNDLENVGRTGRHHTFFEMLGNFSFGDYFKKEAIAFGWELLTRDLGLPKDRLKVTIFRGEEGVPRDAEAHGFWRQHVAAERILELGAKDNFWAMGETGPCGPCSEIHFFQGEDLPCTTEAEGGRCLGIECECDRWLEIWNLVFMQYNRDSSGQLSPLPAPCIDTGMGLERIAAVVQGKRTNYDSDLFTPLLAAVSSRCKREYGQQADDDVSMRVMADHLRAMTFLIADGVVPGNEGRGYTLRKIMRRAMRHGKRLGVEEPFVFELTSAVVERMSAVFPELAAHQHSVARIVRIEEERFGSTLRQAIAIFDEIAAAPDTRTRRQVGGADAFRLYDTYGLPLDFIEELAREQNLSIDNEGFKTELTAQQERARATSKLGAVTGDPLYLGLLEKGATTFRGYETLSLESARVVALVKGGAVVKELSAGDEGQIVLSATPFYGASGGQIGDHGVIASDGCLADVLDCTLPVPGLYVHHVRIHAGTFTTGQAVGAEVDIERRAATMRHHTATHLLNAALRETLGMHVKQSGSLVTPERLRFDFSHYAPVTTTELRQIETRVNAEILRNAAVMTEVMPREQALGSGALAFFGDKYGESVRVVSVPGFSREFCGGTHVARTGDIGMIVITAEQGVAAGIRRIEALAGLSALERLQQDESILAELEGAAKVERAGLLHDLARLKEQIKVSQREIERLKMRLATERGATDGGQDEALVNGVLIWTPRFDGLDRKAHA
ncbi:MAG: alanine--tRNA ligase, partial [Vicinamibacteria bacterium]|nr:alanine--tRNA ligase [Vicinamibacteria bacterium]